MKILAIRGQNLASLGTPFVIEFDSGPLAQSGLFAITGPTGAGKSTILDALCLALFGRTPRLTSGSGTRIKRQGEEGLEEENVGEQDPRSILRHGCGEGYAEVDFVGTDRRRYRARWSVFRARKRPTGRFQAAAITLTNLDLNQPLGGKTLSETWTQISGLLGLTFEQFKRAVLLAQGDFAAFLKADSKDRAELLKAITGTAIFTEIGKGAFKRAKHERELLERIEERLASNLPLDPVARAELDRQANDAQGSVDAGVSHLETLKIQLNWYISLADLRAKEEAAVAERGKVEAEFLEGAGRWERLSKIEAAQPLRGALENVDRLNGEIVAHERSVAENTTLASEAETSVASRREELVQAIGREDSARTGLEKAAPDLQRARLLDAAIAEQQKLVDVATAKAHEQGRLAEAAQEAFRGQNARKVAVETAINELAGRLEKQAALQGISADWKHISQELKTFGEEHQGLAVAKAGLADLQVVIGELAGKLAADETRRSELVELLKAVGARVGELEKQSAEIDLEKIGVRREDLDTRKKRLDVLSELTREAIELCAVREEHLAETRLADRQAGDWQKELEGLKKSQEQRLAELEKLEREEGEARLAMSKDVIAMREHLLDGHPCPVCGSESHPWHDRKPVSGKALKLLSEKLKTVRSDEKECAGKIAELQAGLKSYEKDGKKRVKQTTDIEKSRTGILERWAEEAVEEEVPMSPFTSFPEQDAEEIVSWTVVEGLQECLAKRLEAVGGEAKAVRTSEKQGMALRKQLDATRGEMQKQDLERQGLEQQIAATRLTHQSKSQEAAGLGERIVAGEKRLAEAVERLSPYFGGSSRWPEKMTQDPRAFLREQEQLVQDYLEAVKKRETLDRERHDLAPVTARLEAEATAAGNQAKQSVELVQSESRKCDVLKLERGSLLQGRPADAFEASLKKVIAEAVVGVESGRKALQAAEKCLDELRVRRAGLEASLERFRKDHQAGMGTLQERVAGLATTVDGLRDLLACSTDWIAAEKAALEALNIRKVQAETRLESSRSDLSRHRSTNAPEKSEGDVRGELPVLEETLESGRARLVELKAKQTHDDQMRKAQADEVERRDRQRLTLALWEKLNELIGDAQGVRFNKFAQNISFDILVHYANLRLDELSRRYRLQRIPGTDLELQLIDRELGDEIRSVHGLSGGESFIVSLALALGLASLSAERTSVESLFIDEGFGTLDGETLEIVLAGLDSLQAGGRTIGIISHVKTLIERIGVQVEVRPFGNGRSTVRVSSGANLASSTGSWDR